MVRTKLDKLPSVGMWWIPERENQQYHGLLSGELGAITLELTGSYMPNHGSGSCYATETKSTRHDTEEESDASLRS